jgi:hypothetical protein
MSPEELSAVAAIISAGAALLSVGGLVWSTRIQDRMSKPRLKVRGTYVTLYDGAGNVTDVRVGIDVANIGPFPVTLVSVGMATVAQSNLQWIGPRTAGGRPLPIRLETGEAETLLFPVESVVEGLGGVPMNHVWAKTAANDIFDGNPIALPA